MGYQFPRDIWDDLSMMARAALQQMPPQQQAMFVDEFQKRRLLSGNAYGLWILFGFHYAYLGKWALQILWWVVAASSAVLLFIPIIVWWVVDGFRLAGLVRQYNSEVANKLLAEMGSMNAFRASAL